MLNLFRQRSCHRNLMQQIRALEHEHYKLIIKNRVVENKCTEQKVYLRETFHEVRNALHVITGNIDLLNRDTGAHQLPNTCAELMDNINKVSQQLLDFLNTSLVLAKTDAGILYEKREEVVDIRSWLQRTVKMYGGISATKQLTIQCKVAEDFPERIMTDTLLLGQIIGNLLSNAIKFGPAQSRIKIDCFENAGKWTLVFSNESVVIDPEKLKLIFQPFQTLAQAANSTGLGLAITRKYVQMMDGSIKATCVGKKFLVWVNLPLMIPGQLQQLCAITPPDKPVLVWNNKKVLVIEDNVACQQLICRFLVKLGIYRITIADNGKEGVARAMETDPDLILLDCYLPDDCSLDTLQALKSTRRDIPVIMMSGDDLPDHQRPLQAGASEYILKPFGISKLAGILQKYLEPAA